MGYNVCVCVSLLRALQSGYCASKEGQKCSLFLSQNFQIKPYFQTEEIELFNLNEWKESYARIHVYAIDNNIQKQNERNLTQDTLIHVYA